MCSKILLNDTTIKGLLLQEKEQTIVKSLATEEEILLKGHDTQKWCPRLFTHCVFLPLP